MFFGAPNCRKSFFYLNFCVIYQLDNKKGANPLGRLGFKIQFESCELNGTMPRFLEIIENCSFYFDRAAGLKILA